MRNKTDKEIKSLEKALSPKANKTCSKKCKTNKTQLSEVKRIAASGDYKRLIEFCNYILREDE